MKELYQKYAEIKFIIAKQVKKYYNIILYYISKVIYQYIYYI